MSLIFTHNVVTVRCTVKVFTIF